MRTLQFFALLALFVPAATAEARLFRETYGSIIPADGGCTWNWHEDYFIPRHSTSGRYGLFSACKPAPTTSPACRGCDPHFAGYCSVYGPRRNDWRDHVYRVHCGCVPASRCHGTTSPTCGARSNDQADHGDLPKVALPNVERRGLHVLGSIPVEGNGLLAAAASGAVLPAGALPTSLGQSTLPSLGIPLPANLLPPTRSP